MLFGEIDVTNLVCRNDFFSSERLFEDDIFLTKHDVVISVGITKNVSLQYKGQCKKEVRCEDNSQPMTFIMKGNRIGQADQKITYSKQGQQKNSQKAALNGRWWVYQGYSNFPHPGKKL